MTCPWIVYFHQVQLHQNDPPLDFIQIQDNPPAEWIKQDASPGIIMTYAVVWI